MPELGLWLDARQACQAREWAFISHAHTDHIAAHPRVILSAPTARFLRARLPGTRHEHILPYGQAMEIPAPGSLARLTLLPAGHIFGSAMALLEAGGPSLLYTGDFKLRPSRSAETCTPCRADILVMETTFGRPHYRFPPTAELMNAVLCFCREALDNDETPVLLAYSLGKSQEVLACLTAAGLPVMVHGAIGNFTRLYQELGQSFPPHEPYAAQAACGKVLLWPPGAGLPRGIGKFRTAVLTGWAVDPHCRFRYRCDAAFPLSDHADFDELQEMVRQVQPRKILTLHGFAADFAATLRAAGYDAYALSEADQLSLPLVVAGVRPDRRRSPPPVPPLPPPAAGASLFADFAAACAEVALEAGKRAKVRRVADYLRSLRGPELVWAATWLTGHPFPAPQNQVLQVGWVALREALCAAADRTPAAFQEVYLRHSDLGVTAAVLLEGRSAGGRLTLTGAANLFGQLSEAQGAPGKEALLRSVLEQGSGLEAKYLVKILTGDLRIGLKDGLVEEAIAEAFGRPVEAVRNAHLLLGNIGETAVLAAADQLGTATIQPFRPVRFMLASPEPSAPAVWQRMASNRSPEQAAAEVWLEDKYDGVRCQLHKRGGKVALYSRDLKEITRTFGELADRVRPGLEDFILDGEIVATRGGRALPFAELQRRLGGREGDLFLGGDVPIEFIAFDLLWEGGQDLLETPLRTRRQRLERLAATGPGFQLARLQTAHGAEEVEAAFVAARERGNEGLVIKNPDSRYAPGRRGLAWIKLKQAF